MLITTILGMIGMIMLFFGLIVLCNGVASEDRYRAIIIGFLFIGIGIAVLIASLPQDIQRNILQVFKP